MERHQQKTVRDSQVMKDKMFSSTGHNHIRLRRKSLHGFTLIELLVVIAIIALLLSIVVPSLRMAKEMAREILCLSNQRSITLGAATYSSEYDGKYPPSIFNFHSNNQVDRSRPYAYSFDLRSLEMYRGKRVPIGVGILLGMGFEVRGEFFHCPSLNTIHAVCPFSGHPLEGHGMDLTVEEGSMTWWGGVGASQWNNPDADQYRIVVAYNYRSPSWSTVHGKLMNSADLRPTSLFHMDVIDPRFGIKYAHSRGLNATFTDGSGRFVRVDFKDIEEWVGQSSPMLVDGLNNPENDEFVFKQIELFR